MIPSEVGDIAAVLRSLIPIIGFDRSASRSLLRSSSSDGRNLETTVYVEHAFTIPILAADPPLSEEELITEAAVIHHRFAIAGDTRKGSIEGRRISSAK